MVSLKEDRVGIALALGAALGLGAVLWRVLAPPSAPGTPAASRPERGQPSESPLPRIDLARLDLRPKPPTAGDTDVFQFGAPSTKIVQRATPVPVAVTSLPMEASPAPTPVPTMNVKYIGAVSDKKGLKVAILMTDRKEVLTGRPGDVVANRLKIVSIGLESVDVQDVGSEHVRRIPLRAN